MTQAPPPAHHENAKLPASTFVNVDLGESTFSDVNLRAAAFDNVSLAHATFRNVSFANASLADTNLDGMRIDGVLVSELLRAYRAANTAAPAAPSLRFPDPIATERLVVRAVEPADLASLMDVNGDDAVTRFLPYASWASIADAEAWYGRMAALQANGSTLQFVLVDKATAKAIGTCLLFRHDPGSARAELGYALGRAHWGRGCMLEALTALIGSAFGSLGLRRIEAEVDPRNRASSQLLQRLGFTREGLARQRWVAKGEPKDVELHGLLRSEWPGSGLETPTALP